jgi:hypothetical protein
MGDSSPSLPVTITLCSRSQGTFGLLKPPSGPTLIRGCLLRKDGYEMILVRRWRSRTSNRTRFAGSIRRARNVHFQFAVQNLRSSMPCGANERSS